MLLLLHLVLDSGHDLGHHLTPSLPYLDNPLISRLVDAVLSLNSLNLNWIKEYRYTEAKNECVCGTYKPSPHPSPHVYIYISLWRRFTVMYRKNKIGRDFQKSETSSKVIVSNIKDIFGSLYCKLRTRSSVV